MYKEQSRKTKNGVTIYDYKNPNLNSFYISLFVRAGSMFETESGITHFLEHVAIRNLNSMNQGKLYRILDKCGIELGASTFSEMVQFYVSGATANFSLAAGFISDLLSPLVLSTEEVSLERERIKAEIRESDDKTSLSTFSNNIVHGGTSLSLPITGSLGGVNRITKKSIEAYRRSVMTAENIFFYVTGNYSEENLDQLCTLIERQKIEPGVKTENIAPVSANFGKREGRVYLKNADFTMLRFSFDLDMTEMTMQETDLLYDHLLSGYNSRFFIEMSERRGLFYDISGSSERYHNIGNLVFSYEVRGGSIYEAVETTVALLNELKRTPPEEDSLMKAGYVTNAYLLYDDPRELNFTCAYDNHIMNAGYASVTERAERYARVTPEEISLLAKRVFRPENLVLAVKGNKKKIDLSKLEEILKKLQNDN